MGKISITLVLGMCANFKETEWVFYFKDSFVIFLK